MRRWLGILMIPTLMFTLTVSALAIGPKHGGPGKALGGNAGGAAAPVAAPAELTAGLAPVQPAASLADTGDAVDAGISASALWEQFAQAEAYKKLYELQQRELHEQIRLLEGPGAYYYAYSAGGETAYTQLMELKAQEYHLKTQKEQYEWQKKQAESYLKLTGAKPDRAQLEYALYTGAAAPSGLDYEALYTQRLELQTQEQQLKWQLESLEYQYRLDQISDSGFVSQFAALFQQKEHVKMQREQIDAEIQLLFGQVGPGVGIGRKPLP